MPTDRAVRKLPAHPQITVEARAKKPVSKAYRDNWNAIYAKKEKKKRR
jgi:hypothetical protein